MSKTAERQVDQIDALLPQTQCGQCGFSACRPYAQAIAGHNADINRCPPGGDQTIQALASALGIQSKLLDSTLTSTLAHVVVIDETTCIGCTKCIQACPVDAIIGAAKQMHTILDAWCTGCDLCIPPCPVDCIDIMPIEVTNKQRRPTASTLKVRYTARNERLDRRESERNKPSSDKQRPSRDRLKREIADAIARTRAKRAQI